MARALLVRPRPLLMTLADVVINQGNGFEPTRYSIEPLSVVAVICNGKLTYGVWADTSAPRSRACNKKER